MCAGSSAASAGVDVGELRRALGCFATGVAVVTARRPDGSPVGVTVNSFASVSLDPPLVAWSLRTRSPSLNAFLAASRFAVNVLAQDQVQLSKRFATSAPSKFDGVRWRCGKEGVPLLEGCVSQLQCASAFHNYGGDHVVFMGRVDEFEYRDTAALLFLHGRYWTAGSTLDGKPELNALPRAGS